MGEIFSSWGITPCQAKRLSIPHHHCLELTRHTNSACIAKAEPCRVAEWLFNTGESLFQTTKGASSIRPSFMPARGANRERQDIKESISM